MASSLMVPTTPPPTRLVASWRLRGGRRHARRSSRRVSSARIRAGGPPPAALVIGHDETDLRATADAVQRAVGVRVVSLLHRDVPDGLRRDGAPIPLADGPWPGCWRLDGSAEDAAVCGTDPDAGLVASLGFACVLCVVGATREPCLGSDADAGRAVRAAKSSAVAGVPTVACLVPTTSADAPIAPACAALETMLTRMRERAILPLDAPANCPRSHFPFPTRTRWAALGTPQLPADDQLAAALAPREDFAAADCWSLGGHGAVPRGWGSNPRASDAGDARSESREAPAELRATLRDAFRDADAFVTLHVPPRWEPSRGFAAARPGVLWRQQRVEARGTARETTRTNGGDLWGRTLPAQTLADERASERDARFVSQLATDRLVASRDGSRSVGVGVDRDAPVDPGSRPTGAAPSAFVVRGGTVVADDCEGGDVDAVMAGKAAVVFAQTWPQGHPFALLDAAAVEALRPERESGMPLWLCEADGGDARGGGATW
jgi:hypothetical protein